MGAGGATWPPGGVGMGGGNGGANEDDDGLDGTTVRPAAVAASMLMGAAMGGGGGRWCAATGTPTGPAGRAEPDMPMRISCVGGRRRRTRWSCPHTGQKSKPEGIIAPQRAHLEPPAFDSRSGLRA